MAAARVQINFKISDQAQLTALHATFIPKLRKRNKRTNKNVCGKVWLTHVHNKWERFAIQYENIACHASLHNLVVSGCGAFEWRQTEALGGCFFLQGTFLPLSRISNQTIDKSTLVVDFRIICNEDWKGPDEDDHDDGHEDGEKGNWDDFPNWVWPRQSWSPWPDRRNEECNSFVCSSEY